MRNLVAPEQATIGQSFGHYLQAIDVLFRAIYRPPNDTDQVIRLLVSRQTCFGMRRRQGEGGRWCS
jgi:hypothetical protein